MTLVGLLVDGERGAHESSDGFQTGVIKDAHEPLFWNETNSLKIRLLQL
jgi:hypothetical protein